MNTQKNKETEIESEGNISIINQASFDPRPFLFPSSDFNPNSSYMSCGVLVPQQLHQPGYRNLFSAVPVESAAFLQCGFNDSFCSLSRSTSDTKLRPFEQLVAASDVPLLGNEGVLCSRVTQQCYNSSIGTTAAHTHTQSRVQVACKKQRIRWTGELHNQFVDAVNRLGGAAKATPKRILKLMKSEGLNIFHIKSHLQKYRTIKYFSEDKNATRVNGDGMSMFDTKRNGELYVSEALRLQMDVQKSLHEHLELQRNLQTRIEEHAKCLQRMFDQQNKSNFISEKHNFKNENYPSPVIEQASTRHEDCLDFYTGEAEESNFII